MAFLCNRVSPTDSWSMAFTQYRFFCCLIKSAILNINNSINDRWYLIRITFILTNYKFQSVIYFFLFKLIFTPVIMVTISKLDVFLQKHHIERSLIQLFFRRLLMGTSTVSISYMSLLCPLVWYGNRTKQYVCVSRYLVDDMSLCKVLLKYSLKILD